MVRLGRLVGLVLGLALVGLLLSACLPDGYPGTLGIYAGWENAGGVKELGNAVGNGPPTYAMDFISGDTWSDVVAASTAGQVPGVWSATPYAMIWGVAMLPNDFTPNTNPSVAGGSTYGITEGAAGDFNGYYRQIAQNLVNEGYGGSIIRLGWEFNQGWAAWSADGVAPSVFIQFWQNIVNSMRSVAGQQFRFEWNPAAGYNEIPDVADYYPGNAYVDLIGLDVYDIAWDTYPGITQEWSTLQSETTGLDWLASFGAEQRKAITLPEWGLGWGTCVGNGQPASVSDGEACGGDDPTFINDMAHWIAANDVVEATYWDYGSSQLMTNNGSNFGGNPLSTQAFESDFGVNGVAGGPVKTMDLPSAASG